MTRDLERQGHAWLQVTFPISGSIHARSMNFFSCILWVKKCKEITTNSVTFTRDLVRQGHMTRSKIENQLRQGHASKLRSWLLFLCIPWPIECKKQKKFIDLACILPERGKVTCNHAWPWRTMSRVKVPELVAISLHSLTQKMQETKKINRSSMYTTRDRKGHL